MNDTTKYDKIINYCLNFWPIAILVFVLVIIGFIRPLKDGINDLCNYISKFLTKKEFTIKYNDETITFEYKTKSSLFDIVKINATTHHLGVAAEYSWLDKYYPDCNIESQAVTQIQIENNFFKHFDILTIETKDGKSKKIYFDISQFYNDGGHTSSDIDRFVRKRIKDLG